MVYKLSFKRVLLSFLLFQFNHLERRLELKKLFLLKHIKNVDSKPWGKCTVVTVYCVPPTHSSHWSIGLKLTLMPWCATKVKLLNYDKPLYKLKKGKQQDAVEKDVRVTHVYVEQNLKIEQTECMNGALVPTLGMSGFIRQLAKLFKTHKQNTMLLQN